MLSDTTRSILLIIIIILLLIPDIFYEEPFTQQLIEAKVISLKDRPERRKHTAEILKNKIDFVFFDAIRPSDSDMKGQTLSRGKLGCALSHRTLWKEIVENNRPMLILEDDIVINENFDPEKIRTILNNPELWEVVFLGHCWEPQSDERVIDDFYTSKNPLCRHAYIVSPKGAKKLLSLTQLNRAGDEQIAGLVKNGKLKSLSLHPASISQTFQIKDYEKKFDSDLMDENRNTK